jgi:hypothetical protein
MLFSTRMQQRNMLIDRRYRLRAAVAIHSFEIEGGHPMLAEDAFEHRGAIHRFGCVTSCIFNLSVNHSNCLAVWHQQTPSRGGVPA